MNASAPHGHISSETKVPVARPWAANTAPGFPQRNGTVALRA